MYCSHARESACVEGWCAKWAKRKQVDLICIVGSVNYKFILVQKKEGRKKGEKKVNGIAHASMRWKFKPSQLSQKGARVI